MSISQADKAKKLRALHEAPRAFVIPNPWDAGSARVLAGPPASSPHTSSVAQGFMMQGSWRTPQGDSRIFSRVPPLFPA